MIFHKWQLWACCFLVLFAWKPAQAGSIGNSNVAGGDWGPFGGCIYFQQLTADTNVTTDSLGICTRLDGLFYMGFYADNGSDKPGTLLWQSYTDSIISTASSAFHYHSMVLSVVKNTKYWVAWGTTGSGLFNRKTDAVDSTLGGNTCVGFSGGSFVSPLGITFPTNQPKLGILIAYHVTGGGGGGTSGGTGLRAKVLRR